MEKRSPHSGHVLTSVAGMPSSWPCLYSAASWCGGRGHVRPFRAARGDPGRTALRAARWLRVSGAPGSRCGWRSPCPICPLSPTAGASAPAASRAACGPRKASRVGDRMRYMWWPGGDSRRVTSVAANAAVSPASRATAARPARQAEAGDDHAGRCAGGQGERCDGPVTPSAASRQPHPMISTQSGTAPRRHGCKPFM